MGEEYDARLEVRRWDQPNFGDSQWQTVTVCDDPGVALVATNEPLVRRIEATTFWETFPARDASGHWNRSLCHGWAAAPTYFLSSQVLGITPATPGYRKIRIAPKTFHLTWASGSVPTPHGLVSVSWRNNEDGTLNIEYDASSNCEVELII